MSNTEALQIIAEQKRIKNLIKAIMLQPRKYQGELIEKYMDIMESIAFDGSVNNIEMSNTLDPLYQIAIQMKIENIIDAASYLISVSETLVEENEYRKPLENIINLCNKEKEKTK